MLEEHCYGSMFPREFRGISRVSLVNKTVDNFAVGTLYNHYYYRKNQAKQEAQDKRK